MVTKKWDDDRFKFLTIKYFEAIAIFMVGSRIFLKIYTSATKEFLKAF